jgi:hypothetical protein
MPYITRKSDDAFRQSYTERFAPVDDVSHVFGWASHEKFYQEMEAWCTLINSVIPDAWWCQWAQDFLLGIVKGVYDRNAIIAYDKGVDQGRQIIAKVTETVEWAQNQITNAVTDMRNKIDSEIVDPVRQKASQIEAVLKDAKSKLDILSVDIKLANNDITVMGKRVNSFGDSIKAFDNKLGSFDSKLKGLESTASGLQSQLRDAQTKLNQYKTLIDDLTRRVNNLEGKKTEGFDLLKKLGV